MPERRPSRALADPFSEVIEDALESCVVAVHPTQEAFCVGSRVGDLDMYTYEDSPFADRFVWVKQGWTAAFEPEETAEDDVRAVAYSSDGAHVVCVNAAGCVMVVDSETGQDVDQTPAEANDNMHSLTWMERDMFATGDDAGTVQIWDKRSLNTWDSTRSMSDQNDYISCLAYNQRDMSLVATSGDGTLAVYDVRKACLRQQSEPDEDEMLSCVIVKRGRKVVTGTQEGVLSIFSWGHFEDCSDRFPGHPDTVDCMVRFDEDTVITSGGDGGVRIVSILPNKLLGVVGEVENGQVQDMAMSGDKRVLVAVSDSSRLHLWSLDALLEDTYDKGDEEGEDDPDDDEDDEEDDDGDEDDEDEERPAKKQKSAGTRGTKMSKTANGKKSKKTGADPNFFSGLA